MPLCCVLLFASARAEISQNLPVAGGAIIPGHKPEFIEFFKKPPRWQPIGPAHHYGSAWRQAELGIAFHDFLQPFGQLVNPVRRRNRGGFRQFGIGDGAPGRDAIGDDRLGTDLPCRAHGWPGCVDDGWIIAVPVV